jgi:hypothetical protein
MASAYVASADDAKAVKYLDKYIHTIRGSGRVGRLHARASTPWDYYATDWKNTRANEENRQEFADKLERLKDVASSVGTINIPGR